MKFTRQADDFKIFFTNIFLENPKIINSFELYKMFFIIKSPEKDTVDI